MQVANKKIIQQMYEAEQHADLQIRRYQKIKDECRKAREKMEGVSTLSIQKKSYAIEAMNAVAKRNAHIKKPAVEGSR